MSKILSITNKLFSLKGTINVTDIDDNLCYQAKGNFSFFRNKLWTVTKDGDTIFTIRKKVFSWSHTYMVSSDIGDFDLKRKSLSMKRRYYINNGEYKDTLAVGSFWDQSFKISQNENIIAQSKSKAWTIRDRHAVELLDESPVTEKITVIFMLMNQLEKIRERNQRRQSNNS